MGRKSVPFLFQADCIQSKTLYVIIKLLAENTENAENYLHAFGILPEHFLRISESVAKK